MPTSKNVLSEAAVREALSALPGWRWEAGRLHRRYEFEDFVTAFGWMSAVALLAERMGHHPSWHNVYRTVDVELWTHEAGGVTQLDLELAAQMERLGERWRSKQSTDPPPPGG